MSAGSPDPRARQRTPHGMFVSADGYTLDDLDRAILAVLPEEGAKIGKYLTDAMPVARLRPLVDSVVSPDIYGARLRMLASEGYVVAYRGGRTGARGGKHAVGWQRTAKGKLAASPTTDSQPEGADQ